MFQNVKVGDVLTYNFFFWEELMQCEVKVLRVDDEISVAPLESDNHVLWCNPLTGVHMYGKEYGWLDKVNS